MANGIFSFFSSCKKTPSVKEPHLTDLQIKNKRFLLLTKNALDSYHQTKNKLFTNFRKKTDDILYIELKKLYERQDINDDTKIFHLQNKLKCLAKNKLAAQLEQMDQAHEHSYFEILLIQFGLLNLPLDMNAFAEKCIEHAVKMIEATPGHAPF